MEVMWVAASGQPAVVESGRPAGKVSPAATSSLVEPRVKPSTIKRDE
jgi:hypothetical protein